MYVGVLGKGLVVVNLWTRVRRQFDFRCPRWYLQDLEEQKRTKYKLDEPSNMPDA